MAIEQYAVPYIPKAVWDYYCLQEDVPVGEDYIAEIQQYEKDVLSKR